MLTVHRTDVSYLHFANKVLGFLGNLVSDLMNSTIIIYYRGIFGGGANRRPSPNSAKIGLYTGLCMFDKLKHPIEWHPVMYRRAFSVANVARDALLDSGD